MKRIINFSHPLGEKAKSQIKEIIGEFEEVCIKCHFDLKQEGAEIYPQLEKLFLGANIQDFDFIIPPALSSAACMLGMLLFEHHVYDCQIIWVKMEKGVWVLGNIE